ncbi:hypothetical protein [Nostoc sp. NMS7]|nr:hypothetical protein [Nostoc sp. NMS7]
MTSSSKCDIKCLRDRTDNAVGIALYNLLFIKGLYTLVVIV